MKLSRDARRMLALIAGQALVIIVISAIYFGLPGFLPFVYGVLLTCALNCVKVLHIEHTVRKAVEAQSGGIWGGAQYMLRFLLTGAVLVLAGVSPHINLWGAIAGIFTLQVAAYGLRFLIARDEKTEGGPQA